MNILTYYSPYFPYTFIPIALVALYFQIENHLKESWMRWIWWIVIVLVVAVIGWHAGVDQGWNDFDKGYYHAGRKILRNPSELYNQDCGYVNFPLMAYVFVPFGNLPKAVAGTLFFVIGYVSLIPLGYLLVKTPSLNGWERWLALILLWVSGPLDYSIRLGNITHMIVLIILIALFLYQRGNGWMAGILLGISGLIKIPLIAPAGYFLIRRKWKIVAGGMMIVTLTVLFSLLIIPLSLNRQWLDACVLANTEKPIAGYINQSAVAMLARETIPRSQVFTWNPQLPPRFQMLSWAVTAILLLPVIIIVIYQWNSIRSNAESILEFFIVLTSSLLISPISWVHYFAFLIIPTAYYLGKRFGQNHNKSRDFLMAISLMLLSVPIEFTGALFRQTNQILFLSLHFIGGLLFYVVLIWAWIQGEFVKRQKLSTF